MGANEKIDGFTLLELLLAMAIFGLVLGVASYGYSLFSKNWNGFAQNFARAQTQLQRLDLAYTALANSLPYVVRDDAGRPGFYFLGREEGLTLVTASPIFASGSLAVIRIFREPDGHGNWNLIYEEASLDGVRLIRAAQILPFDHRLTILRSIRRVEFEYFGWSSAAEQLEASDTPELALAPKWSPEFDGLVRRRNPQRIALRLGQDRAVVFVPDRADISLRRALAGYE